MNSYNTDIFFSNNYNLQSVHFEFIFSLNKYLMATFVLSIHRVKVKKSLMNCTLPININKWVDSG